MAFFLLGRTGDGTLALLSDASFATRQDALAELSRITGDASFVRWEEDVLLFDLDAATPVLLVRPSVAATPLPEAEPLADEETAGVAEAETIEPVWADAPLDSVDDPAIADMIVEEAEEELTRVVEPAEPVSLLEALKRTAVHMESTGIVATKSVGPAELVGDASEEEQVESAVGIELAADFGMESAPEIETAPEAVVEPEPEEAVALEVEELPQPAPAAEAPQADAAVPRDLAPWPWDTAPGETEPAASSASADAAVFVINELEEPALDDESILRGTIDDESFASARPVILGSYSEPEVAASPTGESISDPMGTNGPASDAMITDSEPMIDLSDFEIVSPGAAETGSLTEGPAPESEGAPALLGQSGDDISDFILDLESVTTVPEDVEPEPVVAADETPSPLSEYTCMDCVYVETCPNKDQRLPKDCGSFQWR